VPGGGCPRLPARAWGSKYDIYLLFILRLSILHIDVTHAPPPTDGGPLTFVDLLKRGKDIPLLCEECSTFVRRPIRHSKQDCSRRVLPAGAAKGVGKTPPDSRIQGPQVLAKKKKKAKPKYPCKAPGCEGAPQFRSSDRSNEHMRTQHLAWTAANQGELYPPGLGGKKSAHVGGMADDQVAEEGVADSSERAKEVDEVPDKVGDSEGGKEGEREGDKEDGKQRGGKVSGEKASKRASKVCGKRKTMQAGEFAEHGINARTHSITHVHT
jgi:hypothetical protein